MGLELLCGKIKMKHVYLAALIAQLIVGSAHAAPKSKARCRKIINGQFSVEKFDDWSVVTNSMESKLSGVSILKASSNLPNAVPDDFQSKGKMSGTWKVEGSDTWLVCHHFNMKMVIQQKLPAGLKVCKAEEQPDAVSVECQ